MKRITHSSNLNAGRATNSGPCTPFEFLLRIRSSRRVARTAATTDAMLIASAARLVLRSR